jgi:hypothetical protein
MSCFLFVITPHHGLVVYLCTYMFINICDIADNYLKANPDKVRLLTISTFFHAQVHIFGEFDKF